MKYFVIAADTYIDGQDPKLEEELIMENGHNVLVSDMISLDRAIPDFRNEEWVENLLKKLLEEIFLKAPLKSYKKLFEIKFKKALKASLKKLQETL